MLPIYVVLQYMLALCSTLRPGFDHISLSVKTLMGSINHLLSTGPCVVGLNNGFGLKLQQISLDFLSVQQPKCREFSAGIETNDVISPQPIIKKSRNRIG